MLLYDLKHDDLMEHDELGTCCVALYSHMARVKDVCQLFANCMSIVCELYVNCLRIVCQLFANCMSIIFQLYVNCN